MISVILPTYNERGNISCLIPNINRTLAGRAFEILVVDDNSPDGTAAEAEKFPNVRIINQKRKMGVGFAHYTGYRKARGDIIITMDADLSHDPAEIPKMLGLIEKGYDVVVGSRYVAGGKTDKKRLNVAISNLGGQIATRLLKFSSIRDYTNGFRAFRRGVFLGVLPLHEKGNAFLMEFLVKASARGYLIKEIPIIFKERRIGESKTNLFRESTRTLLFLLKARILQGH